jgi:hypothetical protein
LEVTVDYNSGYDEPFIPAVFVRAYHEENAIDTKRWALGIHLREMADRIHGDSDVTADDLRLLVAQIADAINTGQVTDADEEIIEVSADRPIRADWPDDTPVETDSFGRVICRDCGGGVDDSTERCDCPA